MTKPPKNLTGKTVNGVRPSQKKPFKKATQEEVEERVEFVSRLVALQYKRYEIAKVVKQKYNIEFRQCAEYIAQARALLKKQANMTTEDARSLAINVLLENMNKGKPAERNGAVKVFAEITGINAPTKAEHKIEYEEVVVKHANEV